MQRFCDQAACQHERARDARGSRAPGSRFRRYPSSGTSHSAAESVLTSSVQRPGTSVGWASAMDAEMRHDPERLALAVRDVGAEVWRLAS
jgi:hypothetical protein